MTAVTLSSHSAYSSGQHPSNHTTASSTSTSRVHLAPSSRQHSLAADSTLIPPRDHRTPTTKAPLANGTCAAMPSRLGTGGPILAPRTLEMNGRPRTAIEEREPVDVEQRPLSAPGNKLTLALPNSHDDSDHDRPRRIVSKPPLLRSKSERIVRREDADQTDEEISGWGARHGFEDHYQSEDIISQLANVSPMLPRITPLISFFKTAPIYVPPSMRTYLKIVSCLGLTCECRTGTCTSPTNGTRLPASQNHPTTQSRTGVCEIG